LVVRGDDIGDLALTLPLLHAIRNDWPQAHVTLVGKPSAVPLVRDTPLVDDVKEWLPMRRYGSTALGQVRALAFARRELRGANYDLGVLPRWDADAYQTRYLTLGSSSARVIGFDPRQRAAPRWERAESALLSVALPSRSHPVHELQRSESVAAALGLRTVGRHDLGRALLTNRHLEMAATLLSPLREQAGPVLAVALGAGAAKRCWPPRRYAAVIERLNASTSLGAVLIGGPGDRAAAAAFVAALPDEVPCVDATGTLTLKESLAVIALADVYLGGDTGSLHLAGSVDTPAVVVSCHPPGGSPTSTNSPARFGPWHPETSAVLQPPRPASGCTNECVAIEPHCILGIDVDGVSRATAQVLGRRLQREDRA